MPRVLVLIVISCVAWRTAAADPLDRATTTPPAIAAATPLSSASTPSAHLVYLDVLGKGGLWGLGYEWRTGRFALGGVASFYMLQGDRYTTASPYAAIYPVAGTHHAWFVHVGPQLLRHTTPSPGPEWPGMTSTSVDLELGTGYEHKWTSLVTRAYVMTEVGARVVPWLGATIGWTL